MNPSNFNSFSCGKLPNLCLNDAGLYCKSFSSFLLNSYTPFPSKPLMSFSKFSLIDDLRLKPLGEMVRYAEILIVFTHRIIGIEISILLVKVNCLRSNSNSIYWFIISSNTLKWAFAVKLGISHLILLIPGATLSKN